MYGRVAVNVPDVRALRMAPSFAAAKPWKGIMSPKTPAKRKEPEGPTMYVTAEKAYANEHREEYKKKHPDKESKEITKELKAAYEALSDEVKKPYEDAAAKDKQRYIEEMKAVRAVPPISLSYSHDLDRRVCAKKNIQSFARRRVLET